MCSVNNFNSVQEAHAFPQQPNEPQFIDSPRVVTIPVMVLVCASHFLWWSNEYLIKVHWVMTLRLNKQLLSFFYFYLYFFKTTFNYCSRSNLNQIPRIKEASSSLSFPSVIMTRTRSLLTSPDHGDGCSSELIPLIPRYTLEPVTPCYYQDKWWGRAGGGAKW